MMILYDSLILFFEISHKKKIQDLRKNSIISVRFSDGDHFHNPDLQIS
jgi:hypothetical protein